MNILFVGYQDFASVAHHLANALRRAGDNAEVVTQVGQRFDLPEDHVIEKGYKRSDYKQVLKESDMIVSISGFAEFRPFGLPFPEGKITALWNGGTNYRQNHEYYNDNFLPCFDICYAHQDLMGLSPLNHELNQPLDFKAIKFMPRKIKDVIKIGHIPSSGVKGTDILIHAYHRLDPVLFKLQLLQGLTHPELMRAKRQYEFYFDQILQQYIPPGCKRGYGSSLVESAALGSVCMAGFDDDTPIHSVFTPDDIVGVLEYYLNNPEKYPKRAKDCRSYCEKKHSYENVVKQFREPLERLI